MREFKFRAWDGDKIISLSMAHTLQYVVIQDDDEDSRYANELSVEYEDVILMQYTGLKDKNDVEIYEGDIIKAKDYLTKDNKKYFDDIGIVEFKDGMFMICDDFPSSFKGQIIEVIGNIYENKELLSED